MSKNDLQDRSGEYVTPFEEYYLESRILHQTTISYSPQFNGVVKCKTRILKKLINAMLMS